MLATTENRTIEREIGGSTAIVSREMNKSRPLSESIPDTVMTTPSIHQYAAIAS